MDESNLPGKTHTTMPCVQFRCVVVAAAVVVDIKKPVLNYTDYTLISRLQYRSTSPTVIPISAPVPQKWTPHHTLKSRALSLRNAICYKWPNTRLAIERLLRYFTSVSQINHKHCPRRRESHLHSYVPKVVDEIRVSKTLKDEKRFFEPWALHCTSLPWSSYPSGLLTAPPAGVTSFATWQEI